MSSSITAPTVIASPGVHGVPSAVTGVRSTSSSARSSAGSTVRCGVRTWLSCSSETWRLRRRRNRRFFSGAGATRSLTTIGPDSGRRRPGAGRVRSATAASARTTTSPSRPTTTVATRSGRSGSSRRRSLPAAEPRAYSPTPSRCTTPAPGPDATRTSTVPSGSTSTSGTAPPTPTTTPCRRGDRATFWSGGSGRGAEVQRRRRGGDGADGGRRADHAEVRALVRQRLGHRHAEVLGQPAGEVGDRRVVLAVHRDVDAGGGVRRAAGVDRGEEQAHVRPSGGGTREPAGRRGRRSPAR